MVQVFADAPPRKQTKPAEVVRDTYLGYPLLICEQQITVLAPDGSPLVSGRISFATARSIVRRHRLDRRLAEIAKEATV